MKGKGISGKIQYTLGFKPRTLPTSLCYIIPHTRAPGLTEGLHQLSLHAVGHQRLGQFREEGLHGSCHCVDGEIFLHQVQVVVCKTFNEKTTF